jgi:hypothetical protein
MGARAHLARSAIVAIAGLAAGVPGVAAAADSPAGARPDAAPASVAPAPDAAPALDSASVAPAPDPVPTREAAPVTRPATPVRAVPAPVVPTPVRPRHPAVSAPPSFPSSVPALPFRASGGDAARRLATRGMSLLALALAAAGLLAVVARERMLR